jgi:predicted nucleotidyltransferase
MTTLEAVLERIVAVAQPDRLSLFGSAARGMAGQRSDLDFRPASMSERSDRKDITRKLGSTESPLF